MSGPPDDITLQFIRTVGSHLIGLSLSHEPVDLSGRVVAGSAGLEGASGFVVVVEGEWILVTAGHVLGWAERLRHEGRAVTRCYLCDFWGTNLRHAEPLFFDFDGARKRTIGNEHGVDFGMIHLRPYYRRLLAANGVKALEEEAWTDIPETCDAYLLLGLPGELVVPDRYRGDPNVIHLPKHMTCTAMLVTRVESPEQLRTSGRPRFCGQIDLSRFGSGSERVTDISGCSGGPIFGFVGIEGGLRYWIVAVQSGWAEGKFIVGNFITDFGDELVRFARDAKE